MTHSYPPPVRLSQAFDDDRGGGGVTRRTFIKRTGGATVAASVALCAATHHARAAEGAGNPSSYMCAIAPAYVDGGQTDANLVGYTNLIGGGYIYLGHTDNGCAAEGAGNHRVKSLVSLSQIYAKAWVPASTTSTDWILTPQTEPTKEMNTFQFGVAGIERINTEKISLVVSARNLNGDLPSGDFLDLKLQITSVSRTNQSVEVFAKAWLEGTAGGRTYDVATASVTGSGLSMVVENPQDNHGYNNCDVAV